MGDLSPCVMRVFSTVLFVCVVCASATSQIQAKSRLEVEADFIEAEAKKHGLAVVAELEQAAAQGSRALADMKQAVALKYHVPGDKAKVRKDSKKALVALRLAQAQGAKVIQELDKAIEVALQREAAESANKQPPTKRISTEQAEPKDATLQVTPTVNKKHHYYHHLNCKLVLAAGVGMVALVALVMFMRQQRTYVSVVMLEDRYKIASGS